MSSLQVDINSSSWRPAILTLGLGCSPPVSSLLGLRQKRGSSSPECSAFPPPHPRLELSSSFSTYTSQQGGPMALQEGEEGVGNGIKEWFLAEQSSPSQNALQGRDCRMLPRAALALTDLYCAPGLWWRMAVRNGSVTTELGVLPNLLQPRGCKAPGNSHQTPGCLSLSCWFLLSLPMV